MAGTDTLDLKVLAYINGVEAAKVALDDAGAALERLREAIEGISVEMDVQ